MSEMLVGSALETKKRGEHVQIRLSGEKAVWTARTTCDVTRGQSIAVQRLKGGELLVMSTDLIDGGWLPDGR